MEYSALKRKEILTHYLDIMLSEVSQSLKEKCLMITLKLLENRK